MKSANILHQASVIFASNLSRSIAYWIDKMGFESRNIVGKPPEFAILGRDGAFVMLRQAPSDHAITSYWKICDGLWNAYFWVDDARRLFEDFEARGAEIDYGLCEQPYCVLEFSVRDPDGQSVGFGQELNPSLHQNLRA